MEIRRIVFATDLSELSFQAWPAALEFARKWNAPLHAVCVIEEPYALAPYEQYGALLRAMQEMRPEIEQRLRDEARRRRSRLNASVSRRPAPRPLAQLGRQPPGHRGRRAAAASGRRRARSGAGSRSGC